MSFVCSFYRDFQHPRLWHHMLNSLAKRAYPAPISQDQILKNTANRKTNLAPLNTDEKTVLEAAPKPGEDLTGLVGKRFLYKYENGWVYEWYCRNHNSCDYRAHRGIVGGRWVTKQKIYATKFKENIFKVDWHETTGVCVSLLLDLQEKNKERVHGTIFAPQWIGGEGGRPEKAIVYQNEFTEYMEKFRDEGPTYPYVIVCEFADIYKIEDVGLNNDDVINEAPGQMEKEP